MSPWIRRWGLEILGVLGIVALAWLAWWQFRWMGTDLQTPISHGINEDWDWQLGFYEASRQSLLVHGQLPGWNPFVQGGVPLLANPESPFLYPPFVLIMIFGSSAGLKLWVLFHLAALVGACWWAGRAQGLGPIEAHFAGILALCSAQLPAQTAMGHIMYLPLCWLPLAWIASRAGRWRLAGLCLAMPILAGAHHVFLYALLLLGVDALFRMLDPKRAWVLGVWLLLNLLLLGQGWALWPMVVLGVVALGWQRPHPGGLSWRNLLLVAGAVMLAGLLCGPKLATVPTLWARAERLAPQFTFSVADEYSPWYALQVVLGLVDRPSAHNGQNVLHTPVPLLLASLGLVWALRRKPAVALAGLFFLNIGWGGATPVNLLQGLHRIPPWDHIRVVERYSAVWTLFLGWFAAWGVWGLWRLRRWPWLRWVLAPAALLAMGWHVWVAAPAVAWRYHIGPGQPHEIPAAGDFVQVDDELTTWESMLANRGKPRCWTTAWLADPGPVKAAGDDHYVAEVYMADGTAVDAEITPNRIAFEAPVAGTLVVNQNAFEGWEYAGQTAGSRDGLLAVDVPAGPGELVYRPPGLARGLFMLIMGLVVLLWPRRFGVLGRWRRSGAHTAAGASAAFCLLLAGCTEDAVPAEPTPAVPVEPVTVDAEPPPDGPVPPDDPRLGVVVIAPGPFQPTPDAGGWRDPGLAAAGAPCPGDMAHVPKGSFTSGATPEQVRMALDWPDRWMYPRPRVQRSTGAYCIDLYEFPNVMGQRPTVWVGWAEAKQACVSRGRRLCTENEWTRACGGDEGWLYPYGEEHRPGACNDDVTPMGDYDQTNVAGALGDCESPFGVFDMEGNVSEWVDAAHEEEPGRLRVVRGGTMWQAVYGSTCMSRHAHYEGGPTHGDDGFRCCADPSNG